MLPEGTSSRHRSGCVLVVWRRPMDHFARFVVMHAVVVVVMIVAIVVRTDVDAAPSTALLCASANRSEVGVCHEKARFGPSPHIFTDQNTPSELL